MGKSIIDHSWITHAAVNMVLRCGEHSNGCVCGIWRLDHYPNPIGKICCGHGLGNGSVLVSELCLEPHNFIELYDQKAREKRTFGNLWVQNVLLKHSAIVCVVKSYLCGVHCNNNQIGRAHV